MDAKFLEYGKIAVFRDTSKDGLFTQFLKEYRAEFGVKINPNCSSCRDTYWRNYLNLFKMTKKTANYVLKAKYNGIQLGFGGQPLRNGEITDAQAKELIKIHPKGVGLFEKIPEVNPLAQKTKKELVKIAEDKGIEVDKKLTKAQIIDLIDNA